MHSANPFLESHSQDFSFIKANDKQIISLQATTLPKTISIEVLAKYRNTNLYILIKSGEAKTFLNYFSTSMQVNVFENYG